MKVVIGLALAAALVPAAAQASSFDGSCDFSGSVTFSPPMTTAPQPTGQSADARGTCNGRPARYRSQSSGDAVSCAFGLATGRGVLQVGRARIRFTMTEYRGGATPMIRLTGRHGGDAWMAVRPSQSSDPVAAVQACNGTGLDKFELDAHLQTLGAMRG